MATESYVTRTHRNRLSDEVGVWRFDPETGEREVVREAEPLATDEAGVELLDVHPGRTDVRVAGANVKPRRRWRMAERAYGKGWRPNTLPACAEAAVVVLLRSDPDRADNVVFSEFVNATTTSPRTHGR